jgi:hypothetical protein
MFAHRARIQPSSQVLAPGASGEEIPHRRYKREQQVAGLAETGRVGGAVWRQRIDVAAHRLSTSLPGPWADVLSQAQNESCAFDCPSKMPVGSSAWDKSSVHVVPEHSCTPQVARTMVMTYAR